jgi:diaminopimelate decarboxylase
LKDEHGMAFDQITRRELACAIHSGDRLVRLDAGAYHLLWEKHFSTVLRPCCGTSTTG